MSFKTYTEETAKANARTLLPKGIYPFTVNAAYDKNKDGAPLVSAAGNAMISLKLHVHRPDGGVQFVDTFIVDTPRMAWQARQCAATTSTLAAYESGLWGADVLAGKEGWASIDIEDEKPKKDGTGNWPAKNVVKGYGKAIIGGDTRGDTAPRPAARPQPTENELANQTGGDSAEPPPF